MAADGDGGAYFSELLELWELDSESLDSRTLLEARPYHPMAWQRSSPGNQETERLDQLSSQSDCLAIDSQSTVSGSADSSFPPLTSRPCPRCLSANTRHANWCTECGTALISTTEGGSPPVVKAINSESDLSTTPTHYKLLCGEVDTQNEDSQAEIKDGVSHDYDCFLLNTSGNVRPKSGHICTSQSSLLNVPNTKTRHAGKTSHSKRVHNTPSSSPLLTKDSPTNFSRAKSEPMAYQRRWQSSAAVYHWRNPSSLVKASPHNVAAHAVPSSAVVEKPSPSVCEFRRSSAVQKVEIPSLDLSVVEPCCSEIATTRSTAHSTDELYHTEGPSPRDADTLTLLWLPNELLLRVLSHFSHSQLGMCMLVCRRLHLVAADPALWRKIVLKKKTKLSAEALLCISERSPQSLYFHHCKAKISHQAVRAFFQRQPKLQDLSLSVCDFCPLTGDLVLSSAAIHCPNLRSVSFDWTPVSDKAFKEAVKACPKLEKVTINQQPSLGRTALSTLFTQHKQWLQEVDVGGSLAEEVLEVCEHPLPNLTSFAATFGKLDCGVIVKLSATFPQLQSLVIRHLTPSKFPESTAEEVSRLPLVALSLKLLNSSALNRQCCCHFSQMGTLRHFTADCVAQEALEALCSGKLALANLDLTGSACEPSHCNNHT